MIPATGFSGFVARVFSNNQRDTFLVRLGTSLLLGRFGIVGPAADLIGFFVRGVIGVLVEEGIYEIDITLDSLREGKKQKEFEAAATAEYNKAMARRYTEAEKNAIRKEYLEIIARMGNVGSGPKP